MLDHYMNSLQKGDLSALSYIYENTKKAVFSLCYTMMRDYSLAEDMMQDTFLRVMKYISHYNEQDKARSWILRLAKNVCLNEIKKRKREVFSDFSKDNNKAGSEELRIHDESGIIAATIKHLNENESKIVFMHTVGDITLKEIAELMEKSEGTVRWQYNNALKKLRKIIKKEELLI